MRHWYTRWQMSNALDRGELSARMARRHAASCASCQAFGRALGSLHEQLSRDAHTAAAPPRPAPRRSRSPWLVAGPLAAAAAVAIALAVTSGGSPPTPVATPQPPPETVEPIRIAGLADRVTKLLADTPLDTELDNLILDGRHGLQAVLATGGLR
jgi:hypothetical protein